MHLNLVKHANNIGNKINYIFGLDFFRKIKYTGLSHKPFKNLKKNYLDMQLSKTNESGTILLSDKTHQIKKKFLKATTDFIFDDIFYCESRREINNLVEILSFFSSV